MTELFQNNEIFTINYTGGTLPELFVNQDGVNKALEDLKKIMHLEHIRVSNLKGEELRLVQEFRDKYIPNRDELLGRFKDTIVYAELRQLEKPFENGQYNLVKQCLLVLKNM